MSKTTEKDELRDRIEAKRKDLEAKLQKARADARGNVREIETRLGELKELLRDGWDDVSDQIAAKLNA